MNTTILLSPCCHLDMCAFSTDETDVRIQTDLLVFPLH